MRIATWNINSVRIRIDLIKNFLLDQEPDVLCLQETKTEDDKFPLKEFYDVGWNYIVIKGQKSYNGVAILSKHPIVCSESINWLDKNDCRHISAKISDLIIHNFYVPAGGDIPDRKINDKFAHKLDFLDQMKTWFSNNSNKNNILLGDLNIAPLKEDVWSTNQLKNVVSHTKIEREKLIDFLKTGNWCDAIRYSHNKEEILYSWWSYRAKDWKKSNRGRRLDHIWISDDLKNHLNSATIFTSYRDFERPSDHVPMMISINKT